MPTDEQYQTVLQILLFIGKQMKGTLTAQQITTFKSMLLQAGYQPPFDAAKWANNDPTAVDPNWL